MWFSERGSQEQQTLEMQNLRPHPSPHRIRHSGPHSLGLALSGTQFSLQYLPDWIGLSGLAGGSARGVLPAMLSLGYVTGWGVSLAERLREGAEDIQLHRARWQLQPQIWETLLPLPTP